MQIELHFMDGGSHMRRFDSIEDMLTTLEGRRAKMAEMEQKRTAADRVEQG